MKIGYADARGRKGGQRQVMTEEAEKKTILAESYYKQGDMKVNKIDSEIGVLKMTFYKYIRHRKSKLVAMFIKMTLKVKWLIYNKLCFVKSQK